jgi:hypothetical protein
MKEAAFADVENIMIVKAISNLIGVASDQRFGTFGGKSALKLSSRLRTGSGRVGSTGVLCALISFWSF